MLTVNVKLLNEFTSYTFELRAATRIGAGEPATVNLTTAQAGTYLHIKCVSIKKNCRGGIKQRDYFLYVCLVYT